MPAYYASCLLAMRNTNNNDVGGAPKQRIEHSSELDFTALAIPIPTDDALRQRLVPPSTPPRKMTRQQEIARRHCLHRHKVTTAGCVNELLTDIA